MYDTTVGGHILRFLSWRGDFNLYLTKHGNLWQQIHVNLTSDINITSTSTCINSGNYKFHSSLKSHLAVNGQHIVSNTIHN